MMIFRKRTRLAVAVSLISVVGVVALAGGFIRHLTLLGDSTHIGIYPESRRVVAKEGINSVTASYRVQNRTRDNLIISGVTTGCGCSVASIEREMIPPGDDGEILIRATVLPGVERTLDMVVNVDGPQKKTIPFQLTTVGTAHIPHVASHSPSVQFGELGEQSAPVPLVLSTRERAGSDPWIGSVNTNLRGLFAVGGILDEQPSGDGVVYRTYRYELAFEKSPDPGRFSGRVDFVDGNGKILGIEPIPILGYVRAAVSAVPPILYATCDSPAELPQLRLRLVRSEPGGEFSAELVEKGSGVFVEQVGGNGSEPTFSVQPGSGPGAYKGTLIFSTDVKGAERIEVPYLFQINKSDEPALPSG
ncbi:DUF1573 domain-containing protein [Tautonia sp. JC769]|uniref:DUF1573 domain-containing protein n=1 Tax=Tautonia sp. JC769 TaxID=3232135 RepID=UPI00345A0966